MFNYTHVNFHSRFRCASLAVLWIARIKEKKQYSEQKSSKISLLQPEFLNVNTSFLL